MTTIREAAALERWTPVRIISGDFAGYAGKLEGVHTQDGLKRAAVLLPWSPGARPPRLGPSRRDRGGVMIAILAIVIVFAWSAIAGLVWTHTGGTE